MKDHERSKIRGEENDLSRLTDELVKVFGVPHLKGRFGTSEIPLKSKDIFDNRSRENFNRWSRKLKMSYNQIADKCVLFKSNVHDIQTRKLSKFDQNVQMTVIQGAHFNFSILQMQDYLVTKLRHFKSDEICSRLCYIHRTSSNLPWLQFNEQGERTRDVIMQLILDYARSRSHSGPRERLANSTHRALVAGTKLLVSLQEEASKIHREVTKFGHPFQSTFAVGLLQRCIDGKICFTKHMLDMLKAATKMAITYGERTRIGDKSKMRQVADVDEPNWFLSNMPEKTWHLASLIDRMYELAKIAENDHTLLPSLRYIHGEIWTMQLLNRGNARCCKVLSMLRDYVEANTFDLMRRGGTESDQIERAHRIVMRNMYKSSFFVEYRSPSKDALDGAIARRLEIASKHFARRKFEDVFKNVHTRVISILQMDNSTSRADSNAFMVLVEFLKKNLLDRINHANFIDMLHSGVRKIRRKILRRSPRSLSAVTKYVAELYMSERPDYTSLNFEERNSRDEALKVAIIRKFGYSVRTYLPLLLILMRALDIDTKSVNVHNRDNDDERKMWVLARKLFSMAPYSDGRDFRYNSVKQYLRTKFGETAINESNKPRLKAIARNRGIEKEAGEDTGGSRHLPPRTPGWVKGLKL
eukprot:g294.t1